MTGSGVRRALVTRLVVGHSIPQSELSEVELQELASYGFVSDDGFISVPRDIEPLSQNRICELLDPLTLSWIKRFEIKPVIDSTSTALMERSHAESIEGHVLLTELQTQGKGRRGRKWISPFGRNVMLSTGFHLNTPTSNIGSVSLAIGVAVAKALERLGDVPIQLKWPNDIYLNQRKLGGILIDLLHVGPPVKMLLGIGLNVHAAPNELESPNAPAIALAQVLPAPNRHDVVSSLLNELVATINQYSQEGFQSFIKDWSKRDLFADQFLRVDGLNEEIQGWGRGIDESGALQLETSSGIRKIIGGDVTIRRV